MRFCSLFVCVFCVEARDIPRGIFDDGTGFACLRDLSESYKACCNRSKFCCIPYT